MATMIITGAAGFIGRQAWEKFHQQGWNLIGIDNMSRETAIVPEIWNHRFYKMDAVDIDFLVEKPDVILHLAAQTSVTHSVIDAQRDLHDNAVVTVAVCEFAKKHKSKVIFSSTNKVFGQLNGVKNPIGDAQPLSPQTPYGISKAAAACYVRDLLPDSGWVFHQSCIYGETQVGTVDQGWVGWLRKSVRDNIPITCFGDGTQIRDLLHVEDLLHAYEMAICGNLLPDSYVIGGGIDNAVTFAEMVSMLGGSISSYKDWRPNDQRYFVSKNEKLNRLGWKPKISYKNITLK